MESKNEQYLSVAGKQIPITGTIVVALLNYLSGRPYMEVSGLIQELNKDLRAFADAQKAAATPTLVASAENN